LHFPVEEGGPHEISMALQYRRRCHRRNRVVTLTGTVKTQAEKNEALEIARKVQGVTSVTDRLTVEGRQ
jgi:hypothetical protein